MKNRRSGENSTWCVPSPSVRTTRPVPSKLTRAEVDVVRVLPAVDAAGAEPDLALLLIDPIDAAGPPTRPA